MKNAKILVIDDAQDTLVLIRDLLESMGISNITECDNGEDAMVKIHNEQYNLIISDWVMPKYDGIMVLKFLRNKSKFPNTPLIMLTSNSQSEQVVQGISAGVNDYVVKPFEPKALKEKIEFLLDLDGDESASA